ncbi:MAG: histidinol-phosphate transaminase [Victivallaceae bacterium]|nr:histidinol-phosphate transaminase [Victivallaceae bacterium]
MRAYKDYFRKDIQSMTGYTPGEQPKMERLIKLNTNENPYPPSPKVFEAARSLDCERLRRYPDPLADHLCSAIAELNGCSREQVMAANGSDDVFTIFFRAFVDANHPAAALEPTYSLYKVLAAAQGAKVMPIPLNPEDFSLPEDLAGFTRGANVCIFARPNAPTGNTYDKEIIRRFAENFDGIVMVDEAYADFAADNCMDLALSMPNVLVSRTSSKSYSLAGLRFGYVVGNARLIHGMLKLKDSYNLDRIAQTLAEAAVRDVEYRKSVVAKVLAGRAKLTADLKALGFRVIDSAANFVFAAPPDDDGEKYFRALRDHAIIVRYFPGAVTGKFVRITVGTPEEMRIFIETTQAIYRK